MDGNLTTLLRDWREGDVGARDRLLAHVYDALREMAAVRLRRGGPAHTLQPTAVVNEAMIRLLGKQTDWQDRAHFFALAALAWGKTSPPPNAAKAGCSGNGTG